MEMDYLWMIHYEDDVTFKEKLDKALNLQDRYKINRADAAQELYTDCGIPCGPFEIKADKGRLVKDYYKVPFQIFSREDDRYRLKTEKK